MLINRLRNVEEFKQLKFPQDYLETIDSRMPEDVRDIFVRIFESMLRNINVPEDRINDFTDQIKEARMGRFMEHFNEEGYDWQATRNQALAEGEETGKEIGDSLRIIKTVRRLIGKGRSADSIADDLGEELGYIREISDIILSDPLKTDEEVLNNLRVSRPTGK